MKSRAGVTDANAVGLSAGLPKAILTDVDVDRARAAVEALTSAGAKAEIEIVPVGTDIAWNWGIRRSVAHDYLYDSPVLLGSLRVGPDLANVGARLPDANWHYRHLYAPRSVVEGSAMPAYPYLFERRPIQGQPSPDAIESKDGFEIVPTSEARALVAYLLSLRADVPLFESPVSVEPPPQETADTNSAAGTNVVSPQASASAQ
ncbi:MAG TPA: hypothetical protein GYA07_04250 [Verrucomicrobia bacterium]|nr:hypothetical protein [Verrucomicrobiota bacterium]